MQIEEKRWAYRGGLMLLIIFAGMLAFHCMHQFFFDARRFPVNTVKIEAPFLQVPQEHIEAILTRYVGDGFFAFSTRALRRALLTHPWVKQVEISRIWPDRVKLVLLEKKPIAIFQSYLMDETGELFDKDGDHRGLTLPLLQSPWNHRQKVLQVYQKLSNILSQCHLSIVALDWQNNDALELVLSTGVRLYLGKRDATKRILRFCQAWPVVFGEHSEQLLSVDLRYSHGMAVRWKK